MLPFKKKKKKHLSPFPLKASLGLGLCSVSVPVSSEIHVYCPPIHHLLHSFIEIAKHSPFSFLEFLLNQFKILL